MYACGYARGVCLKSVFYPWKDIAGVVAGRLEPHTFAGGTFAWRDEMGMELRWRELFGLVGI